MMDNLELGKNVETIDVNKISDAYTKVSVYVGTDQQGNDLYYVAGDDTGLELQLECPWGTQAMADNILASISGYQYQGFEAGRAIIDPAYELGDSVEVDGNESRIYAHNQSFDALFATDISAPAPAEIEEDYPFMTPEQKQVRKLATTVSTLSVNVDSIEAEVSQKTDAGQVTSLVQQTANGWTFTVVDDVHNNKTEFKITGTGVNIDTGKFPLHANYVDFDTCVVEGTLSANRISALNKEVTLLADSTGTDLNTVDVMWIGPHTKIGNLDNPNTTLQGTYLCTYLDRSISNAGITYRASYMANGRGEQNWVDINSDHFNTVLYEDNTAMANISMHMSLGIDIWCYSGSNDDFTEIQMYDGEITFTNKNGSCTLSQILAVV